MRFPLCTGEYLNLAGAGICGTGSLASTVITGLTPLGIASLVATIGCLTWTISALVGLSKCLKREGRTAEVAKVDERIVALEREVDRLKQILAGSTP